jgi:hypothetical protein
MKIVLGAVIKLERSQRFMHTDDVIHRPGGHSVVSEYTSLYHAQYRIYLVAKTPRFGSNHQQETE